MTRLMTVALVAWGLAGTTACDARAGSSYEGEPLLSLRGSVVVQANSQTQALVPALAFLNIQSSKVQIVDVAATGSFPASFELDVLVPPPPGALMSQQDGEHIPELHEAPPFAIGYITAVPTDHPDAFFVATETMMASVCGSGAMLAASLHIEPSQVPSWSALPTACAQEVRVQAPLGVQLYHSIKRCQDRFLSCEVVVEEGEPGYSFDAFESFAGFSTNYLILYLASAAPAGIVLTHSLSGGAPLAAGYHLFAVRPWTDAESAENVRCWDDAEVRVLEDYNRTHGTSYADYRELNRAVGRASVQSDLASEEASFSAEELQLQIDVTRARLALGCFSTQQHFERVTRPEEASISVQVGPVSESPPFL